MIPESKFPDLTSETERRTTGLLMAVETVGQLKPISDGGLLVMVRALARLVDGAFLDYQAARQAYYRFYTDKDLGGLLPISAALVPMFHHIENCLSNMERVREMADAIRTRKSVSSGSPLIDKNDWRIAETREPAIADLRNAVQHSHNDLKAGKHVQGAIQHRETGHIALGGHELTLADLAKTLQAYRRIAEKAVKALQVKT